MFRHSPVFVVFEKAAKFYKRQKHFLEATDQALHLHGKRSYFCLWVLVTQPQPGSFVLRIHAVIKRTHYKHSRGPASGSAVATAANSSVT